MSTVPGGKIIRTEKFDNLSVNKSLTIPKITSLPSLTEPGQLSFSGGNLFVSSGSSWSQVVTGNVVSGVPEVTGNVSLVANFPTPLEMRFYKNANIVTFRLSGITTADGTLSQYSSNDVPSNIIPSVSVGFTTFQKLPGIGNPANVLTVILESTGSLYIRKNDGTNFLLNETIDFGVIQPQFTYRI